MELKKCSCCGSEKSVAEFHKETHRKDGLSYYCKSCASERRRASRAANPEKFRKRNRKWREANPEKNRAAERKWREANPDKNRDRQRKWHVDNLGRVMLNKARYRAKKGGYPCTITEDDILIPEMCPRSGMPLVSGVKGDCSNSPSLDKIIPELGYIPGNVEVVSLQYNVMKQRLSNEELVALCRTIVAIADAQDTSRAQSADQEIT